MKSKLTFGEKIADLRTEKGLKRYQVAEAIGVSSSTVGNYESNDDKDLTLEIVVRLAKLYGVSVDYLLGLTDIKNGFSTDSEFNLDEETREILKKGSFNNRLLCEVIKHPDFWKFMCDMEIYIDSLAQMQIRNLNDYVTTLRSKVQLRDEVSDSDLYLQTLNASRIDENEYFSRLIGDDITHIAKDIKEKHRTDSETGDENSPLTDVIDIVKEYKSASDPEKATLAILGKQLGINFNKMDPMEFVSFSTIVQKYSTVYKNAIAKKGRGKKKKK